MYYGFYYGMILTTTSIVTPETPTPIVAPTTIDEPEPTEHVAEAIERLAEQYKP